MKWISYERMFGAVVRMFDCPDISNACSIVAIVTKS